MSGLKCIVSKTMNYETNRKGNAAELAIAAEAARLDLLVYYPLTEHGRADLVLGIGSAISSRPIYSKGGRRYGFARAERKTDSERR